MAKVLHGLQGVLGALVADQAVAVVPQEDGEMHCPKCEGATLVKRTTKNIELDRCPSCKGLWFDQNELSAVLGVPSETALEIPSFSTHHSDINCPKCNKGLSEFCYPGTTTLVDVCIDCHGTWLDNLEWKEIILARDIKNQINCPKCHKKQKKSDTCVSCGIIFSKFNNAKDRPSSTIRSEPVQNKNQDGMDDIRGIKGILIRFVHRSIEKLTQ